MYTEEKDDVIMPEGFEEGDDIFDLAEEEEAPTTEQSDDAEENDEAEETVAEGDDAPTTEPKATEDTPKAKIKVKFNHEEREMDEDEARPLLQKGLNYDKIASRAKELEEQLSRVEGLTKKLGYEKTDEMIVAVEKNIVENAIAARVEQLVDEGNTEALAEHLARTEYEREQAELQKKESTITVARTERDKELDEFVRLYPGVTKVPPEVAEANNNGVPLTVAYERFKNKQAQDELKILKQNQSSAAKAPVGSATKHGSTKQKAKDPFEIGFDSDGW